MKRHTLFLAALAPLMLTACDSATAPEPATSSVVVRFGLAGSGASTSLAPAGGPSFQQSAAVALQITGSNGTLMISDLRLVVAEFELDITGGGNGCDDDAGEDSPRCGDFKAPPAFVSLPLDGGTVSVASGALPAGTYDELEFEVENLDDNEEDPEERRQIEELRARIVQEFPDFPGKGSMVAVGEFRPAGGGAAVPFRVYFDAEVEIELDLNLPLVVADGASGQTVSVTLDPAAWFRAGDGRVAELSQFDYARTGRVVELEMESGLRARSGDD